MTDGKLEDEDLKTVSLGVWYEDSGELNGIYPDVDSHKEAAIIIERKFIKLGLEIPLYPEASYPRDSVHTPVIERHSSGVKSASTDLDLIIHATKELSDGFKDLCATNNITIHGGREEAQSALDKKILESELTFDTRQSEAVNQGTWYNQEDGYKSGLRADFPDSNAAIQASRAIWQKLRDAPDARDACKSGPKGLLPFVGNNSTTIGIAKQQYPEAHAGIQEILEINQIAVEDRQTPEKPEGPVNRYAQNARRDGGNPMGNRGGYRG